MSVCLLAIYLFGALCLLCFWFWCCLDLMIWFGLLGCCFADLMWIAFDLGNCLTVDFAVYCMKWWFVDYIGLVWVVVNCVG